MNKYKKIFLILVMSLSVNANIPTTEGLFRNGSNADVSASLIVVKFLIEKEISDEALNLAPDASAAKEEVVFTEKNQKPVYVKFLISLAPNDRVQLIQVSYSSGKMLDSQIIDVRYYSNLIDKIVKTDKKTALFYSLLSSLALNRSDELDSFLKLNSKNYKSNDELVDPEKKALYSKYKRFLNLTKEDESLKESMDNPYRPQDPDIAKVVNKVKASPYMKRDENVSLVKENNQFFWKVSLDTMEAFFENDNLHLEKLSYGKVDKDLRVTLDDYILFNGNHEMPKHIKILDPENQLNIRTLSLAHLNMANKSMNTRYSEYMAILKEANSKVPLPSLFIFR